jgi:hypothetical protein
MQVDEFVYQFQSYCQYRGKVASKSPEEIELLKQCDKVRTGGPAPPAAAGRPRSRLGGWGSPLRGPAC